MSTSVSGLRVVVVADDPLARAGLASLLAERPGYAVVGQAAGQAGLPLELDVYGPDVVVWDLGWDPAGALERLADLQELGLRVVALLPDEAHVAEAWSAGARGLLLRTAEADRIAAAIVAVGQGTIVVDPELAGPLLSPRGELPVPTSEGLTRRELEVLRLLAEGLSNKAIAHRLSISEHTVKFHINAILGKLGAQSRTEAVIRATRQGLILL